MQQDCCLHSGRGTMLATLEMLSFHAAVFGASSVVFFFLFFIAWSVHFDGQANALTVWVLCSSAIVVLLSMAVGAYKTCRWKKAQPDRASIVILVGHLAPVVSAYLYSQMLRAGTGSGVVFLPLIAWAILFYPIGIVMALSRLASVRDEVVERNDAESP